MYIGIYITKDGGKKDIYAFFVGLLDVYNEALKKNKPSKHTNIEFDAFQKSQASSFDKIYDELIMRGFKVEFNNYLLRVGVTYNKEQSEEGKELLSNIRVELDDMNHIQELCSKNTLNSNARFVSKRHVDEERNAPYDLRLQHACFHTKRSGTNGANV